MQKQDILQKLESFVHGQAEALERVSRFLVNALYSPKADRPHRGVLLLPGVSSTGRQHLARVVAKEFLGGERSLVTLDCSVISSAPAVIQQLLIERGRRNESGDSSGLRLVLIEQIERATPQVVDLWAHVFTHGAFDVDAKMRLDFRNCFFFVTVAMDARDIVRGTTVGFQAAGPDRTQTERELRAIEELQRILPPHFMSAFDAVAVFAPLGESDLERIADSQIESIKRTLEDRGIALNITPEIRSLVVRQAKQDPLGGARAVKRALQEVVEYPIADLRATGAIRSGDDLTLEASSDRVIARIIHREGLGPALQT
jgi:ATP-dependent Clp protease ATP-binding subunit ClpC